ncbi:MAG: hypothetical protein KDA33_11965 [Phycisphaerales bacterium]|nr:hypothetical protein [Phycisphaerales bacterium]
MKHPLPEPSSNRHLIIAICFILWVAGVFGWVVLFGERFIGPNSDSAAFIARIADLRL